MPRGKNIEDAGDGLRGIVCVDGRQHEVPGFGSGERCSHGFAITHFSYQDYVGILTQYRAYRLRERRSVMANLDLLNDRGAVCMLILDRVFDGDDVIAAPGIDQVELRSKGRGFATARG